jgi:colanic acid biosynthesis glycosyl transferase WcaI
MDALKMPKILILYHFYEPDDVVSAVLFSGLGQGLAAQGLDVEVWPSNRSCHHENQTYSLKSEKSGEVLIRRVWRPAFQQHRLMGRVLNALWVETSWFCRALFSKTPDMVIIGTDPIFSVLLVPFLKMRWPRVKIAHWCFDLYPEAAVSEGLVGEKSPLVRFLKSLLKGAYAKCDLIADLGVCMKDRLSAYSQTPTTTLTPWALEEPDKPLDFDPGERKLLFGESPLGLLYSGNLSHPNRFDLSLILVRRMKVKVVLAFSARGSRWEELKASLVPEEPHIRLAAFAPFEKLEARLSAPDVHLVSLKDSYTGVTVPSKFFGALAMGRPVLFEGSHASAIARWIEEYKIGWVLNEDNLSQTAEDLENFSRDEKRKTDMFRHCHEVYRDHFSKKSVLEGWIREIRRFFPT